MPSIRAFAVALFSLVFTASPSAADTGGFRSVRTAGGVTEYTLDSNGLGVLLLEDHSAPVVTVMVTYRVGSRNEVTGTTGATHLLEHLMFKGSRNFHPGIGKGFDTVMDSVGAISNATTSLDSTSYFENLPSDRLGLALEVEADRMRGLLLREEDRASEMTVVRNEFERGENDAGEALDKEVGAVAWLAHPYHHPTIGWLSDIEKVPIAKLRDFYDTFYWPDNATVTLIGDFDAAEALALVKKRFGAVPRAPKPFPQVTTEEPAQTGPRRVTVKRPGEVGAVEIAYKVPSATHPDQAPLAVLAHLLGDGKTSRLYRGLVDKGLAIDVDASKGYSHDNALMNVSALLAPGATHEQVEKALLAEVGRVVKSGVSAVEVSRAVSSMVADAEFHRDGSFAIADELNASLAAGDWTLYARSLDLWKAVTPAEVDRVARTYLVEDHGTTGWFVPVSEGAGKGEAPAAAAPRTPHRAGASARGPHYWRDPGFAIAPLPSRWGGTAGVAPGTAVPAPAPVVHRRNVAGIDVITRRTQIRDVVTIRGAISGGDVFNPPGNSAIADLATGMLDKGTTKHDQFAIAEQLAAVGATIDFASDSHVLEFHVKCLRRDLGPVVALLAEQLRTPRFDPHEFAKLKKQIAGEHEHAMEDPDYRASDALGRAIFPEGHPNRPPAGDRYLADLRAATLAQVRAFHDSVHGPASAHLVAVGDVDDREIDDALRAAFAGWTGGKPLPASPKATPLAAPRTEVIAMPGKTSVSIAIGQPSRLRYSDPDYQALRLGTAVLGSGFFSARLLHIVRSEEGLTYDIGAALGADTFADGEWAVSATFAPALLDRGLASTTRELKRFAEGGITPKELDTFRVALTGAYKVALSTTGGLSSALLRAVERGYGPEWIEEYPKRLEALTLPEVNGAIRKYVDVGTMVTVEAGTLPGPK